MPLGMFVPPIAGGVVERRRRCLAAERTVVSDVCLDMPGDRLPLGQNRHGRVVGVQPLGRQHMGLDQSVQRLQDGRTGADLVGERRDAQVDAFAPVPR